MLAAVRDILVVKLSNNFEKLLEMEILGTCHDINHVIKLVFFILFKVVSDLSKLGIALLIKVWPILCLLTRARSSQISRVRYKAVPSLFLLFQEN